MRYMLFRPCLANVGSKRCPRLILGTALAIAVGGCNAVPGYWSESDIERIARTQTSSRDSAKIAELERRVTSLENSLSDLHAQRENDLAASKAAPSDEKASAVSLPLGE